MDPWIVEVSRGALVESRHVGHGIVVDASGASVLCFGDAERLTFPRSSAKWIQSLALILSGASDRFQLGDAELALACASHNGEPEHLAVLSSWLDRLGLNDSALECGIAQPFTEQVRLAQAASRRPLSTLHHCCSGKHLGMLSVCLHLGLPTEGYTQVEHPLQAIIRAHMTDVFEHDMETQPVATDGCSLPTYALPLHVLARGFARLASGRVPKPTADAAMRLFDAQVNAPWMVAGTDRLDTALLTAGKGRLQVKMGAEGVYCGALIDRGLGFALKCEDGSLRGQEALIIALLEVLDETEITERLPAQMQKPDVLSARGERVGGISVRRGQRERL